MIKIYEVDTDIYIYIYMRPPLFFGTDGIIDFNLINQWFFFLTPSMNYFYFFQFNFFSIIIIILQERTDNIKVMLNI